MKKYLFILVLMYLVLAGARSAMAFTAQEIVDKANQASYYQGDDGRARVHMIITDSVGRARERDMAILRKDSPDGKDQKYYVYFMEPDDVRGMTYIVWKKVGTDDDRWMYLPGLDLVRRIASSDKRSSFVGSNFTYEDISGRGAEEDSHELLGEEDGKYKIKSVPKDPGSVEFDHYIMWINKKDFMPVKAELYDPSGKKYKILEALEIKDIQGFPTVTKMKATDLNSGGNTVSEFSNVEYNLGLDDNIFTERYLRRPPRKYLEI